MECSFASAQIILPLSHFGQWYSLECSANALIQTHFSHFCSVLSVPSNNKNNNSKCSISCILSYRLSFPPHSSSNTCCLFNLTSDYRPHVDHPRCLSYASSLVMYKMLPFRELPCLLIPTCVCVPQCALCKIPACFDPLRSVSFTLSALQYPFFPNVCFHLCPCPCCDMITRLCNNPGSLHPCSGFWGSIHLADQIPRDFGNPSVSRALSVRSLFKAAGGRQVFMLNSGSDLQDVVEILCLLIELHGAHNSLQLLLL